MKFRGKMTDLPSIRLFAQLLNILQKSSKLYVLRIMPDKLVFVLSDKEAMNSVNTKGCTAWCEIPKDSYFTEYMMEGITPQDNEIYLEVHTELMSSGLSSVRTSHNVVSLKMKLTKKLVPCITLEIELQNTNSTSVCTHDIPVKIVTRRHWNQFEELELPAFDVSLEIPEIRQLRLAVDRLRNLGPKLSIKVDKKESILTLSVESYNVSGSVKFRDLRIYHLEQDDDDEEEVSVLNDILSLEIDMKSFHHLIPSEASKPPTSSIISLVNDRLLHLLFTYGDVALQYRIPGASLLVP